MDASTQSLIDTYREIVNVIKARLATDDVGPVLTEDDRQDLEEWQAVFENRAKGKT